MHSSTEQLPSPAVHNTKHCAADRHIRRVAHLPSRRRVRIAPAPFMVISTVSKGACRERALWFSAAWPLGNMMLADTRFAKERAVGGLLDCRLVCDGRQREFSAKVQIPRRESSTWPFIRGTISQGRAPRPT